MKRFFQVFLTLLLSITILSACGENDSQTKTENDSQTNTENDSQTNTENDFPTKDIDFIVPAPVGGGTDVGLRTLQPYLEEELGVKINVINNPGAGQWLGLTDLLKSDPDGYTLSTFNAPGAMGGYINPEFNRDEDLDSFTMLANVVTDSNIIAVNKDEDRFTNIHELIEYAKENSVTVTASAVGGDDHLASQKLNEELGTQFKQTHSPDGTPEMLANVMGSHVDVLIANVGEVTGHHENEELNILAVMAEEETELLPGVPSLVEEGYPVTNFSSRGIVAPAELDPYALEVLSSALENAINNKEHIEKMEKTGLRVDYKNSEGFKESLLEIEDSVNSIKDILGW